MSEKNIRNTKDGFRSDAQKNAIILTDENLKIIKWNSGARKMYGWTEKQAIGKKLQEAIKIKNLSSDRSEVVKEVKKNGSWEGEVVQVDKDGNEIYAISTVVGIKNEAEEIVGYYSIVRNIQSLHSMNVSLQKKISQQNIISELSFEVVSNPGINKILTSVADRLKNTLDVDFVKILSLDQSSNKLLYLAGAGWKKTAKKSDFTISAGKHSQAGYALELDEPIYVKDTSQERRFEQSSLLEHHNVKSGISTVIRANNRTYGVVSIHSKKVKNYDEQDIDFLQSIANLIGLAIEKNAKIVELKKLAVIVESSQDAIFSISKKGKIINWNTGAQKLFGYKEEEIIGKNFLTIVPKQNHKDDKELFQQVLSGRTIKNDSAKRVARDGRAIDTSVTYSPITTKRHNVVAVAAVLRDISESKRLERSLAFLLYASKTLGETLDYMSALERIAENAMKNICDLCEIYIVNENNHIKNVVGVKDAEAQSMNRVPSYIKESINTGTYIEAVTNTTSEKVIEKEFAKSLRKNKLSKGIVVPIRVVFNTIGALAIATNKDSTFEIQQTRQLGKELSQRIALAVENARLFTAIERERIRLKNLLQATPAIVWETRGEPGTESERIVYTSENSQEVHHNMQDTNKKWAPWNKNTGIIDRTNTLKKVKALYQDSKEKIIFVAEYNGNKTRKQWLESHVNTVKNIHNKNIGLRGVTINITSRMKREKRKDEFISMASHELKTPLTSMKVYAQLLQQDTISEEKKKTFHKKIETQVDKLSGLVNDLLDLSRIQVGKLSLEKEKNNFVEVTKDTVESVESATNRKIKLIAKSKKINLEIDKDRIGQVIMNFLTNAVKYSTDEKPIIVNVKDSKSEVRLEVIDNGIGIKKRDQKKIFNRFHQVEENNSSYPGLGVGLFISKQIIERHGGKIGVESKYGYGSTFFFTLQKATNNK